MQKPFNQESDGPSCRGTMLEWNGHTLILGSLRMLELWKHAYPLAVAAVLACNVGLPTSLPAQTAQRDSIQRHSVRYQNGSVMIAATLLIPFSADSAPGVVIVHGSGSSARDNPWTTAYVEALVRRGIAVLYSDKRGSGESTGEWRQSSVSDLAADARAGIAFLRRQRGVDSVGVGIMAFSQGGYIAAMVAAETATTAFTVVVSGGTASLRHQIVDELILEAERREEPLSEEGVSRLQSLYGSLFTVARQHSGWGQYAEEVAGAKASGGPLAYALRTIPFDSTHWAVGYIQQMGDFDPMPYWSKVEGPVAFVYGGLDTQVRVDESIERLRSAPSRNHFSIITLAGNGHALFRDDATAFLTEWIRGRGKHR